MEPRPILDGCRLIAPEPTNHPLTSPKKSLTETGMYGTRHISTTRSTHHLAPKHSDALQELNRYWFVIEKVHQKTSVRNTVIPQHPTSVRKPGHVGTPSQAFFVFRYHFLNTLHHCSTLKTRNRRMLLNDTTTLQAGTIMKHSRCIMTH